MDRDDLVSMKYDIFITLMDNCGPNYFGSIENLMNGVDYIFDRVNNLTGTKDASSLTDLDRIDSILNDMYDLLEDIDERLTDVEEDLVEEDEYVESTDSPSDAFPEMIPPTSYVGTEQGSGGEKGQLYNENYRDVY